jgi:hypothetical protein
MKLNVFYNIKPCVHFEITDLNIRRDGGAQGHPDCNLSSKARDHDSNSPCGPILVEIKQRAKLTKLDLQGVHVGIGRVVGDSKKFLIDIWWGPGSFDLEGHVVETRHICPEFPLHLQTWNGWSARMDHWSKGLEWLPRFACLGGHTEKVGRLIFPKSKG